MATHPAKPDKVTAPQHATAAACIGASRNLAATAASTPQASNIEVIYMYNKDSVTLKTIVA